MNNKNNTAIELGFKYQIGYFDNNGNYSRLGFLKTKRSSQILTYAKKYNCDADRLQIQILN